MRAIAIRSAFLLAILMAVVAVGVIARPGQARPSVQVATFPLMVDFDPTNLDPATTILYQGFQATLNGFAGLPDARSAFFAAYNPNNGFEIGGWYAMIVASQPNGNGYLVTLSISPSMMVSGSADSLIFDLVYQEQYQVNNDGTFAYVTSFDPNGQTGLGIVSFRISCS